MKHEVELFWRGQPGTYGWQCLDCPDQTSREGYDDVHSARGAGERHGWVAPDAPPLMAVRRPPGGTMPVLAHVYWWLLCLSAGAILIAAEQGWL